MTPTTLLTVNRPAVIFDVQGDETVIIHLGTGHYFRLDAGSSSLWARFSQPTTIERVAGSCDNPDELATALDGIVDNLLQLDLLRPADERDGSADTPEPGWRYSGFALEHFTDLEDILGLDPIHEVDPVRGWPHVPAG